MNRWAHAWAAALFLAAAGMASAATFTVTKTTDTNDGTCDADCSLREAVVAANALAGADTIVLPAGNYVLTLADTDENLAANGDLDITDAVTISGPSAGTTFIDGNNTTRVLHVLTSAPVDVLGVTIRNGNVTGFGGGIHYEGSGTLSLNAVAVSNNTATAFGGGINNNAGGTISLVNANVTGNTASSFGGGINNNVGGSVTLQNVRVTGNTAQGFGGGGINNNSGGSVTVALAFVNGNSAQNGGGINNNSTGTLTIAQSSVDNNAATGTIGGGGILNNSSGTTTITASTISDNTGAGFGGGGIDNNSVGSVTVTNSTISGNATTGSNGGGGIYNNNSSGSVTLNFVTVASNASGNGGRNLHDNGSGGNIIVGNSIVANPTSGANCGGGSITSQGSNLASDASCGLAASGDLQNTNPLLASLAANGGPTETHALQAGSPAVDAANPTGAPPTDQRGVARPVGAGFDIGAFEGTIGAATPTLSINNVAANEGNAGTTTFTFTVTLSAASASTVTVGFATADGTAAAGSDYTAASGTLTFAPGVLTQPVAVAVLGDGTVEATETFFVNLANPVNATIAAGQGTGTVTNDDGAAPPPQRPTDIPTLSEWALLLMSLMLAGVAWRQFGRRRR